MEEAERTRKSIFTVPQSFGQGTCLWFCLLGFYFALFGNLVVHVELLVHSGPPEILSVQPPECSHSYMPLCSASWLCFQGRVSGYFVVLTLYIFGKVSATDFPEVCYAQTPGVWPHLPPPRPGPAALPMTACS